MTNKNLHGLQMSERHNPLHSDLKIFKKELNKKPNLGSDILRNIGNKGASNPLG